MISICRRFKNDSEIPAITEGVNIKIQAIKANARGFRNFSIYQTAVLLFCGRLNIAPLFLSTLFFFVAGCDDEYNRKLTESLDCLSTGLQIKENSLRKWEARETERILRYETRKNIEKGIVYIAYYGAFKTKNNYTGLTIKFVCGDASVTQVQVFNKGEVVASLPARLTIKDGASRQPHTLCYAEGYIWRENELKDPIAKYQICDLSVVLVKKDGSTIGPVQILARQAVMDKVNAM